VALAAALLAPGRPAAQGWGDFVPAIPRTQRGIQGDAAKKLSPPELVVIPPGARWVGPDEVRIVRVRVYVSEGFKQQNARWQTWLGRLLARLNQRTARWPGVRFEVVETRAWNPAAQMPSLAPLLDDLGRTDAGTDVDLVIGLAPSIPVVPDALDNIGMARLFSRHMVLRGIDPGAEYAVFRNAFDALTPAERDEVLLRRRAHAEEVLFLHEWVHSLGLIHVHRAAALMSPRLSTDGAGLSANEGRLIEIARKHQLAEGTRWTEGARAEVNRVMAELRDPDWNLAERDVVQPPIAQTRVPAEPASAHRAPESALTGPDRAIYLEAVELDRRDRIEEATTRLAFIEKRHASSSEVKLLACRLAWRRPSDGVRAPLVESACRQALTWAPQDPRPWIYLADVAIASGELEDARASLERARAWIAEADPTDGETARVLAEVAGRLDRAGGGKAHRRASP
jgi:hypothetical protein